jgi:hypothetical protein
VRRTRRPDRRVEGMTAHRAAAWSRR